MAIHSRVDRSFAVLAVLLMTMTLVSPLVGNSQAIPAIPPINSAVPNTVPSPVALAPPPEEKVVPTLPPEGKVFAQNDLLPPQRIVFPPTASVGPDGGIEFATDTGRFYFAAGSAWMVSPTTRTTQTTFTVARAGRLLTPGAVSTERTNSGVTLTYLLLLGDSPEGAMAVRYEFFEGRPNKITADFSPARGVSAPTQIVWLAITDADTVRTTDMTAFTSPEVPSWPGAPTSFGKLSSATGCYYGGCESFNNQQFSSLGDVGDSRIVIGDTGMRVGDSTVVMDYSDAVGLAHGVAHGIDRFQYAGVAGHAVSVVFDGSHVDPSLINGGGDMGQTGQRNVFFDGQAYWAFWRVQNNIAYTYSFDGLNWNNPVFNNLPGGGSGNLVAGTGMTVAQYGKTVAVLWTSSDLTKIMMVPGQITGVGTIQWSVASPIAICDLNALPCGAPGSELFEDQSVFPKVLFPPSALFLLDGLLVVTTLSSLPGATRNVVRLLAYYCSDWIGGCSGVTPWVTFIDALGTARWTFIAPFSFGTPVPIIGVLYGREDSQLQVHEVWQNPRTGSSVSACDVQLDWGNNHGALPGYSAASYIASTTSSVDGLSDLYLSYVSDNKIVHYRLKPSATAGVCDKVAESYNVYSGSYPASHLSAGSEIGTSGEYVVWSNGTSATTKNTYNSAGSAIIATRTYTDDFAQHLMKIADSVDNAYTFIYTEDGQGRRVKSVEAQGTTNTAYYAYDGDQLAYNTTSTSGTASWYVYAGSRVLFRFDGTTAHFYEYDTSGNVRVVWKYSSGLVAEAKYRYKPFGEQVVITSAAQEFRFRFGNGAQHDASTALYKMGPRFYDSTIGRFLERDPIGTSYVYAANNPIAISDPSGLAGGRNEGGGGEEDDIPYIPSLGDARVLVVTRLTGIGFEGQIEEGAGLPFSRVEGEEVPVAAPDLKGPGMEVVRSLGLELDPMERIVASPNELVVVDEFGRTGAYLGNEASAGLGAEDLESPSVTINRVPNPYGSPGGPLHQALVEENAGDIESRGPTAFKEYPIRNSAGDIVRKVDVAGLEDGDPVEFHQVGLVTQSGFPIAREWAALLDIYDLTGIWPEFDPYAIQS